LRSSVPRFFFAGALAGTGLTGGASTAAVGMVAVAAGLRPVARAGPGRWSSSWSVAALAAAMPAAASPATLPGWPGRRCTPRESPRSKAAVAGPAMGSRPRWPAARRACSGAASRASVGRGATGQGAVDSDACLAPRPAAPGPDCGHAGPCSGQVDLCSGAPGPWSGHIGVSPGRVLPLSGRGGLTGSAAVDASAGGNACRDGAGRSGTLCRLESIPPARPPRSSASAGGGPAGRMLGGGVLAGRALDGAALAAAALRGAGAALGGGVGAGRELRDRGLAGGASVGRLECS
jgi:hypothetical protein